MEDFFKALLMAIFDTTAIDTKWLKFSGFGNFAVINMVNTVWKYLAFFGVALTLVYFLIELNSKLALEGAQNMTMKSFMAPFLKLAIACVVLTNGGKIVGSLLSVNDKMVDYAKTNILSDKVATDTNKDGVPDKQQDVFDGLLDNFKDFNIVEKGIIIIVTVLVWVVSMILSLAWIFKAIMYKLEVLWRTAVTPVALADVYSGSHSNALRWLKGFIGLSLYAMAFMAMPRVAAILAFNAGSADDAGIWGLLRILIATLIAPFAALGVMGTIKQMCKEALG